MIFSKISCSKMFGIQAFWDPRVSEVRFRGKGLELEKMLTSTVQCINIVRPLTNAHINPGPAGPVSIRFHYACLCGGPRINPVSPVSSFTLK